jgi:stage V sporulation protein D (sporulation-specific penicillin-binding protein)
MTPIQLIAALAATVNGGNLMQPYIVHQILDPDGNLLETTQPVIRRQVVSAETSDIVRDLVEGVVTVGSGRLAAIPGYRIGGKTGTSEKLDRPHLNENILSFVGFVPMEDPQYAVLVMLDGPIVENVYGSTIAAPVVGNIMQDMLPYLGLEPQYTQEELEQRESEVPNLVGQVSHDARAILTNRGLQTRIIGSGGNVIRQIPQPFQRMPRGGTVILYTDDEAIDRNIVVPDVTGLTAQEANVILAQAGLNITLRGTLTDGVPTIVREQWPRADSAATTGDVVTLTLVRRPAEAVPAVPSLMAAD